MDLLDLIGDSRTDSLPAGFLRSVKMKYKQESSRVFPPGSPYNMAQQHQLGDYKRADSAASIQSTPVGCVLSANQTGRKARDAREPAIAPYINSCLHCLRGPNIL